MRGARFVGRVGLLVLTIATSPAVVRADADSAPGGRAAEAQSDDIRRVVALLGHPVPSQRQAARRQLVQWGLRVTDELRRVAEGPNLEAAFQARDLLEALDSAFFQGGQISVEADRAEVDWDEPFALTVTVRNPTRGPLKVTWAAPTTAPASGPADEAAQVAALLDVADFLVVRGPDGQEVDVRIDPIERDPVVRAVVERRASGTQPTHLVGPGGEARLRIPEFNRGWARYPTLSRGKYQISIRHQPAWKDQNWVEEGLGLIESPPIEVRVRSGAPASIRHANRPMRLQLKQTGGELLIQMRNLWDRPQWVNLDFGDDMEVQARLTWQAHRLTLFGDEDGVELEPRVKAVERREHLLRLAPDEATEVGRVSMGDFREALVKAGGRRSGRYAVTVRYQFLSEVENLRAALAARKSKIEVPTHLYTGVIFCREDVNVQDEAKIIGRQDAAPSKPSEPWRMAKPE
ncbi:MAG TPA: hypothetical protein PLL20_19445 [Phycisphaerae bacterium]|nr:hypothetical protein [Phycisphaerae bacterium]HRR86985.1 hypothetical protein [Phycisphaerae bacterium]